ncbi:type II secretion system secretin GspD [Nitrosophilus labii]|uniref:type II secretion system secretin GspD n=1 Tax=Nitrosophilus labii TaxID=2706014 RepID=UPI00165697C3|nr:type II secretion system secretin GspD [Nitrosophilus labii]
MRYIKILILILFVNLSFAAKSEQEIVLNFQNLSINNFIKMVAKITGKNILSPESIRGDVNFISVKPIKKDEVFDLLLNVLKNKGYTIVESPKGYLLVVKSKDAIREAPPFFGKTDLDQIQTDIIGIKYVSATKIFPSITPLLSRNGKASLVKDINTIIVTDFPKNLILIKKIVSFLDKNVKKEVVFIPLNYANVSSIYSKLVKIASTLYPVNTKSKQLDIISNEATNTIIIIGDVTEVKALREYVKELDKKDDIVKPKVHIVKLKNSDCEEMQKVLNDLVSKKRYDKKETKPSITIDKPTNTLIILSSQKEFEELKKVIDVLDIDRQQVYVKAKIVEISGKKASQIGAKYGIFGGVANSSGLYSFSTNLGGPAIPFDLNELGIEKPTLTQGLALGATISLLETNGAAKKLSEPSLLCVNNTESTIYVGQTESVITQGTVGAKTTDYTKNVYTRQDIGLTLKIKPRISSDNKVSLDIKTVIEDILPGSQIGLPITSKREMDTTTIVKNGQSIIIGGLVKDNLDITTSKVPLLGDIPILGNIFKYEERSNDKTTLVILLTPYIVKKSEDLNKLRALLGKLDALEKKFAKEFIRAKKDESNR